MGTGGVPQGLLAACAAKAAGGGMLGRLLPLAASGSLLAESQLPSSPGDPETRRVRTVDELVAGRHIFFAATAITDNPLLDGVRYHGARAETASIILRAETGIRRVILAEHVLPEE